MAKVNTFLTIIIDFWKKLCYFIGVRNFRLIDDNGEIADKVAIKGKFYKVFFSIANLEEYFLKEPVLLVVLFRLIRFAEFGTNFLKRNGEPLLLKDIQNEIGTSRITTSKYIKRLLELGLLKKIKVKSKSFFVLNPFYFFVGEKVSLQTYFLFKGE